MVVTAPGGGGGDDHRLSRCEVYNYAFDQLLGHFDAAQRRAQELTSVRSLEAGVLSTATNLLTAFDSVARLLSSVSPRVVPCS